MKLWAILIVSVLAFCMLFALCGCEETTAKPANSTNEDAFVFIDSGTNGWIRFYDKDTHVMYVFYGYGNRCGITVMLDE